MNVSRNLANIAVFAAVSCTMATAAAGTYLAYSGGPIIGHGFDPQRPTVQYAQECFELAKPPLDKGTFRLGNWNAHMSFDQDRSAVYKQLNVDVRPQARAVFGGAGVTSAFESASSYESDAVTYTIFVSQVFDQDTITINGLKDPSLARQPTALLRACGPEYVSSVTYFAQLVLYFSALKIDARDQSSLKTSLQAAFSTPTGAGFNVDASTQQRLQQIMSRNAVRVSAFGFGAGGIKALRSIVNAADLPSLLATVNTYLATFDAKDAAIKEFHTGDIAQFDKTNTLKPLPPINPDAEALYIDYADARSRYLRLHNLVSGLDTEFGYLSAVEAAAYRQAAVRAESEYKQATKRLEDCIKSKPGTPCTLLSRQALRWPANPELACSIGSAAFVNNAPFRSTS